LFFPSRRYLAVLFVAGNHVVGVEFNHFLNANHHEISTSTGHHCRLKSRHFFWTCGVDVPSHDGEV